MPIPTNVLDEEGLPRAGIERTVAHHILGRPNPLAKRIVYALIGGPKRNAELAPLLAGKSPNNLTQTLRQLEGASVIVPIVDARTRPPGKSYRLTTFGLIVVDWIRRYEFLEELEAVQHDPTVEAPA